MKRKEILEKALQVVEGARQEAYGNPEDNFNNIANLWTCFLQKHISSSDVAVMMILMKVARLKTNPSHEDSWLDICGYGACGGEINHKE